MKNSVVVIIFSVFIWKYPCLRKLPQEIKVVYLSWNLEARLIRICRIHGDFHFFSKVFWICKIQWWFSVVLLLFTCVLDLLLQVLTLWKLKSVLTQAFLVNFLVKKNPVNLTHLFPMHRFSTPWKHQKTLTLTFSDAFRGYKKGTLRTNGLIYCICCQIC